MESRKEKITTWTLLALVFIAGMLFKWGYLKRSSPLTLGDLYFYQGIAQAFLVGDWEHFWHFHFYPLYPVLLALCHRIFSSDFISTARWLNLSFDALSAVPIYLIGKSLYGNRAGLFSALFWSLCWPKIRAYGDPEPVYGFFVFTGFALMFHQPERVWKFLIAVSLASFAGLIKSESMLFVLFFSLMYLLRSKESARKKIVLLIISAIIYLGFTSPLWVKYYQITGKFNPNPKSRTLSFIYNYKDNYQVNLYGLKEDGFGRYSNAQRIYIQGDRIPIQDSLLSHLWQNRKNFSRAYLDKLNFALEKYLKFLLMRIFPASIFLSIIYFIRGKRNFDFEREAWLWLWAISVIISVSFFDVLERFFYPLFPVLTIISAKGLMQLIDLSGYVARKFYPDSKLSLIIQWSIAGFFILWFFAYNLGGLAKTKPDQELAKRFQLKTKLARELKFKIAPNSKIICRGFPEPITYFLGIPFWQMIVLPYAQEQELLDYARENGARYMFIEQDDLKKIPSAERWLFGEVETKNAKILSRIPRELSGEYYAYAFYELSMPADKEKKEK